MYIDTNYNPLTQGVNYSQNDAIQGGYIRELQSSAGSKAVFGWRDGTSRSYIYPNYNDSTGYFAINTGAVDSCEVSNKGMVMIWRSAANMSGFTNNKVDETTVRASNSLSDLNISLLNATGQSYYWDGQLSFYFAGKYLDSTKRDSIQDNFEAYMDANGKGVI